MSLAMKRLKNIGWLALVFLVAILLYPLSLNVAAMHSDLVKVDRQILDTKRDISYLQAELRTRASLAQLQEWNKLEFGYAPPTPEQFIDGESALANLDGHAPVIKPVMVATSVVPAGIIGNSPTVSSADVAIYDTPSVVAKTDKKAAAQSEKETEPAITRTQKLAQIDEKLLSDDVMKDISRRSQSEKLRR